MSEKANYVPQSQGQAPPSYGHPEQPAPITQQGSQPPRAPTNPPPEIQHQTQPPQEYGTSYHGGDTTKPPIDSSNPNPHMYPPQAYHPAPQNLQPSQYPTAFPLHALQRTPQVVDCPVCGQREMTRTEAVNGKTTHGWAAVLCCCACIGCIPYFVAAFKDVDHHCGRCGHLLATYHGSGHVVVHPQRLQPGQQVSR